MADTARTLITDALLDLGVLSDEEIPTAPQAVGALRKLNDMIDSWNIQNLMTSTAKQNGPYALTASKGVYTVGTGGDIPIPRPARIQSIFIRDVSQGVSALDYPVPLLNNEEWQSVPFKSMQAPYPFAGAWVDYSYPLVQINLTPVPNSTQYSLIIWTSALVGNLLLDDVISLPPGYRRAMVSNLVMELAASYGSTVSDMVMRIAVSSKKDIMTNNVQIDTLDLPRGLRYGGVNMYTGDSF